MEHGGSYLRIVKIVALMACTVIGTMLIVQNTEVVEFRLLFWTVSMSRIILLSIAIAIGFTAGVVTMLLFRSRI